MSFTPRILGHSSYGQMKVVPGTFVTAGVGVDPTELSGAIVAVEQLDEGASNFFRVTFDAKHKNATHTLLCSVDALLVTDDMTVANGSFVADGPAPAITEYQIDVVVRNAGTITAAAGHKVSMALILKS